jgi:hypothetical protein
VRVQFDYRQDGAEVALGFSVSADALCLRLTLPQNLWQHNPPSSAPMWRALRTARFFDLAWSGDGLAVVDNPFVRKWLAEIYFTTLTFDAMTRQVSLAEADASLADGSAALALPDVLAAIFQSRSVMPRKLIGWRPTGCARTWRRSCTIRTSWTVYVILGTFSGSR